MTPDVGSVWPRTKPESVAVNGGFAAPKSRDLSSAVTVSGAFVTVIVKLVVPTSPVSSVTVTVTGKTPGEAVTAPVTVHVRVPGWVESADVVPTASDSPAGSPTRPR